MLLYPGESVSNNACLFFPQLYDWEMIEFMKNNLEKGDIFLDIGVHIGFYSLSASGFVGKSGQVLSIEADVKNYSRLRENIKINELNNIFPILSGVSDKKEILKMKLNFRNTGQNSFLE
jgi:predicted RNA methylase